MHGFDVALANCGRASASSIDRTEPVRALTGARLCIVRTNSKELRLQKWEDSCGAQLAACLHLFSAEFSHALIGGSDAYDELWLPWGTNPVTDHLLSGGQMAIVHDGAAFCRTDKIAFLADVPAALRSLKVCWEGKDQGRNCGVCEKCVRTQINLMAVGVADAPCFDRSLDPRGIRGPAHRQRPGAGGAAVDRRIRRASSHRRGHGFARSVDAFKRAGAKAGGGGRCGTASGVRWPEPVCSTRRAWFAAS